MLSLDELHRYKRQIVLPEFGLEGQKKLKNSSVFIAGAGGLGSPLSLYLVAAGIGRIGIADFDTVDKTNLQRQILFGEAELGKNKAAIAAEKLKNLNPNVAVEFYTEGVTEKNIMPMITGYDVIADATDNFSARYLINDACVILNKPLVSGSVYKHEGTLTVYNYNNGPCLRCVYPAMGKKTIIQSCADAGVIGSVTGVIGSLQAGDILKLITGMGNVLSGRTLVFDSLQPEFHEFIHKRACVGKCSRIKSIESENYTCEIVRDVVEISPRVLKEKLNSKHTGLFLIDLRENAEEGIPGSLKIARKDLQSRMEEFRQKEIILYCDIGIRSELAAKELLEQGIDAKSLSGGYYDWLSFSG